MANPPTVPRNPHSPRFLGKVRIHPQLVERRREHTLAKPLTSVPEPMLRLVDSPRPGVPTELTPNSHRPQDTSNPSTVQTPTRCRPQHQRTVRLLFLMSRK
jgi:hypothetical protein